jgi:putative tryptophan/tyrosine transport system substrate-binding protein
MTIEIGRRQFISALGGATVTWPLAARAQQSAKRPIIGVLGDRAAVFRPWTAAFAEGLRELGWIDGRSVTIEYRWSEGQAERAAEIAAEFVSQKVDVIVTYGGAIPPIKQATTSIPIVFAIAVDPLGSGFVASLSQPGGNVTGLSMQATEIASKRLELLREIIPGLRRLATIFDGGYGASVRENADVDAAARTFGLDVASHEIRRAEDVPPTFDALKGQADALYVVENALIAANRLPIITQALNAKLPVTFLTGDAARDGALISYGPNIPALFRRAADYVDKILHGTKPAELPVEQPTKFDLVINLKTAKALGLTVPPSLLALADEVIE